MAKIISYKFLSSVVNHGTEESTDIKQAILPKSLKCNTQADFERNYPIAEKEAVPGTIEVNGEFDPEPEPAPTGDSTVWDELDAAYQEGVDSV